jgi:hypothetical protein
MPYTRPQLWLLLALAGMFLAGLGVREWRAGFPEIADRLERFDREPVAEPTPALPIPPPVPPPRAPRRGPTAPAESAEPSTPKRPTVSDRTAPSQGDVPAPADPRPLDLNTASTEQIARLPGIGPALARRIVEERKRRGRFESSDALRGVLGLGPKKLAAVSALVVVTSE